MAIGADFALPSRMPSAIPARRPAPATNAPQRAPASMPVSRAPTISDAAVQSAVNNQMAAGYGARETAVSSLDRAGISRGKGQQYAGQVAQEAADAEGQVNAARTVMGAAQSNAQANRDYEKVMADEQLANASLLEGLRNTSAMERLARQGWQQDLREAIGRGRFGLNSMQLDYSSLLQHLFD